jgi:hypothetical protein
MIDLSFIVEILMKQKLPVIIAVLLVIVTTAIGCVPISSFDRGLNSITKPYRFSLLSWEFGAIASEIGQSITLHESPDRSDVVIAYFNATQADKVTTADGTPVSKLKPQVEKIIQRQVRGVISELGIKNPFSNFMGIHFPPLSFVLSKPPNLLVTSPRDKIEILKEVRLQPNLTVGDMESIESQTAKLGVSALVVEPGGISTFPSFVNSKATLLEVLTNAAHEWLHQYLAFKPLGFHYVLDLLGITPNYDIVTINETVAGMFGDEVGALVYNKYYSAYQTNSEKLPYSGTSAFDFNAMMRNIRLTVDSLLAQGQIDRAEQYMETQREFLQTKGYYIRRLNQAYFAFNGTYASEPTSVSPIGTKIKEIRNESPSIRAFIDTMSSITSLNQLKALK